MKFDLINKLSGYFQISSSTYVNFTKELLKNLSASLLVIIFCLLLLWRDPGLFWHDDYQVEHLPVALDIARSWSQGEVPLLSLSSWFGGALAGEYQYGTFSVFVNLVYVLLWKFNWSLPTTAAVYSMTNLAVLAAGSFRLARQRNLSTDLAILVGLVSCLSGWIICWGASSWPLTLAAFAWLPWTWWSLELVVRPQSKVWHFILAGTFIYLTLAAGWPFAALMISLITVWLGLKTLWQYRSWKPLLPLIAAWGMGIGLASPAILMLAEYNWESLRSSINQPTFWTTPPSSFLGMVLPSYLSAWQTGLVKYRRSIEQTVGLVPVVVLIVSTIQLGKPWLKSRIWDWGLFILCIILTISPGFGSFQYSFRWLPLLHLVMVLLAVEGLDWLRHRSLVQKHWWMNFGGWSSLLVLLVWLKGLSIEVGVVSQTTTLNLGFKLLLLSICWTVIEALLHSRAKIVRWTPVVVALLSFWLTYTHVPIIQAIPYWTIPETVRSTQPFDPQIRYLSLFSAEDAHGNIFSRTILEPEPPLQVSRLLQLGNMSMYSGLEFINGYSPQPIPGLATIFQFGNLSQMPPQSVFNILLRESGRDGLLKLMGVDGLVISPSLSPLISQLPPGEWKEVAEVDGAVVLHRLAASSPRIRSLQAAEIRTSKLSVLLPIVTRQVTTVPLILLDPSNPQREGQTAQFASVSTQIVQESRRKVVVNIRSSDNVLPALILFSRAWYPGYQARLNGKSLPVRPLNLLMPAVELPPGVTGELVLEYFPLSLKAGLWIMGVTLLMVPVSLRILSGLKETTPVSDPV